MKKSHFLGGGGLLSIVRSDCRVADKLYLLRERVLPLMQMHGMRERKRATLNQKRKRATLVLGNTCRYI